ncbi:hypothetical protein ACSBR2_039535 [Camellia fascicularis]
MVGFEDEAMKMREQLTGGHKHLNIISIVGMPRLGKTTLARKVYNDPLIMYHLYIRMRICVSQNYQTRNVLLGLLSSIKHRNDIHELSDGKLSELLYKCLKGKRYLVVMDDIWDTKVFRREMFSRELEEIGKKIAKECRGLPLSIVVVPGMLADEEKRQDWWKQVEESINSPMGADPQLWMKT